MSKGKKTQQKRGRWQPTNLLTSLIMIVPLLVFYEIGVTFSDTMNGADLITRALVNLVGPKRFIWVQLGLLGAVVALAFYMRRKEQFELRQFLPVLIESTIYALTMGTLIVFVMVDFLHVDPRLAASTVAKAGPFDRLVMAIGAGVHEELVFRLLMMGGLTLFCSKVLKLRDGLSLLIALAVSSVLFSAAHHVGALGDPLRLGVFIYRLLAGALFGLLYRYRSFAIAVYTHALYDVYVMLIV